MLFSMPVTVVATTAGEEGDLSMTDRLVAGRKDTLQGDINIDDQKWLHNT
jgi:hypothetical protein